MKTLYLMRHAKSDWDASYSGDHERPLAQRGIKAARRMGKFLGKRQLVPEVVLSSTAVRARTTLELAKEAGGWQCNVELVPELYHANPQSIIYALADLDDSIESVMLVGHEPTWSSTVRALTGANVRFPTGAVTRIELLVSSWSDVRLSSGELHWLITPRLLKKR